MAVTATFGAVACEQRDPDPAPRGSADASPSDEPEPEVEVTDAPTGAIPGCDVPLALLERAWRGHYPGRSGDVITIERYPAHYTNRHSTPWPYTQNVPLILYGPGYIKRGVEIDAPVTVADIAPTFAELLGFGDRFGERDGNPLRDALLPEDERNGTPRLIFTVVWDGGGDNVLERWPSSWPALKDLMRKGVSYSRATVGSTPSITSTVHSTIGTGDFPRTHGQPDGKFRVGGKIVDSWPDFSPRYLESTTVADEWDRAMDNRPLIGMMARDRWHAGMVGHGSRLGGADDDIAVFDDLSTVSFRTKEPIYSMPGYVDDLELLERSVDEVDLRDGEDDGRWLGNPISAERSEVRTTPAWPSYQTDRLLEVLRREGFGSDRVPDLFYTNYKSADLAGHAWNMVEPEVRDLVREQDRQLPTLISALDRLVGKRNYVLTFTADHGQTPTGEVLGGWPIKKDELTSDLKEHLGDAQPSAFIENRGYYIWLDREVARSNGIRADDVSGFIRNYRLKDNVTDDQPLGDFADERNERIYTTALTAAELRDALDCARRERPG